MGVGQVCGLPTSAQREQLVLQNITGICALVHQVQLSDDPDGALTWGWQERVVYTCTCPHTGDPRHSQSHPTPPSPSPLLPLPTACLCSPHLIHSPQ